MRPARNPRTRYGFPLSTTHVTGSAIAGIGAGSEAGLNGRVVRLIGLAWTFTAPCAALIAAAASFLIR